MARLATSESLQNEQPIYEVSDIVGMVYVGDKAYYRVSYVGFGPLEDTWEPRENLDCSDALERFYQQLTQRKMLELQTNIGRETVARMRWWSRKPRSRNWKRQCSL